MKCNRCEKNPATVKLTRIVKGKVVDLNLCQSCAAEISPYQKKFAAQGINALIAHLLQSPGKKGESEGGEVEEVKISCPSCGISYQAYKHSLMLGCPKCYEAFGDHLLADIRKIHGSTQHVGRVPPKRREQLAIARVLDQLKREMETATKADDFERAAQLRDRIKSLQTEHRNLASPGE